MTKRIMVVDDSNVIRNRISRGSSKMDFEVVAPASTKPTIPAYAGMTKTANPTKI